MEEQRDQSFVYQDYMLDRLRTTMVSDGEWEGQRILVPKIIAFTSIKPYSPAFTTILSALSQQSRKMMNFQIEDYLKYISFEVPDPYDGKELYFKIPDSMGNLKTRGSVVTPCRNQLPYAPSSLIYNWFSNNKMSMSNFLTVFSWFIQGQN